MPEQPLIDLQRIARPDTQLPHVGTYVREMCVSVERMYENTLDWAHLPHLHSSSFERIELEAQDDRSWRARVWSAGARADASSVIELTLDPECRRWITRTVEGRNVGSEIWTHCIPTSDDAAQPRLQVVVDFFVPGLPPAARTSVSAALLGLYKRLYDEDEAMMIARQAALDRRIHTRPATSQSPRALGTQAQLRARLPLDVELGVRRYRVFDHAGALHAHALDCPHMLAPLDAVVPEAGVLSCPWHGFRFDLNDGTRLEGGSGDVQCRLAVQRLRVDADDVVWIV